MKRLAISLLLCISGAAAFSQVTLATPDQIDKKISAFATSLDSTVKYSRVTAGVTVLNADTLLIPVNTQVLYQFVVDAMNPANGDAAWGQRSVLIENVAGTYKIAGIRSLDGSGFVGERTMAKCAWTITLVSNLPVVRLTGVGTGAVNWSIRKTII